MVRYVAYSERTTWITPRRQKNDNPDMAWGLLILFLVAAGAVTNGWGGALAGLFVAGVLLALFHKD